MEGKVRLQRSQLRPLRPVEVVEVLELEPPVLFMVLLKLLFFFCKLPDLPDMVATPLNLVGGVVVVDVCGTAAGVEVGVVEV